MWTTKRARLEVLEVRRGERALRAFFGARRAAFSPKISALGDERHAVERQLEAVPERAEHDLDVDALRARVEEMSCAAARDAGAG